MRLFTKVVPPNFNLFEISCTHFGSYFTHESGITEMMHMVNSEYAGVKKNFVLHHGDVLEGRFIDDSKFSIRSSRIAEPLAQTLYAAKFLMPIVKNLIVMLEGNHDLMLRRWGPVVWQVCDTMRRPELYGTYSAKIDFVDKNGQTVFKQFLTHGRKMISSVADDLERELSNMKLQLKRQLYKKAGDCFLMSKGHTHKLIVKEPVRQLFLTDDGFKIRQGYTWPTQQVDVGNTGNPLNPDLRYYLNVGAFYRLYAEELLLFDPLDIPGSAKTSYVETLDLDPIPLGFCVVRVRDYKIAGVDTVKV